MQKINMLNQYTSSMQSTAADHTPKFDDNWPAGGPNTKRGTMFTKGEIESLIGMPVCDFNLYVTAFSYNPLEENGETFERLEFLGDSVLGFLIARYLYDVFPGKNEGVLTRLRVKFVSGKLLSKLAHQLGLHEFIIMSQKGLYRCWHTNPKTLEDAFEALIGAIYLDLGINAARQFLMSVLTKHVNIYELMIDANHKDRLAKHCRTLNLAKPTFVTTFERGGTNSMFVVEARIDNVSHGEGTGTTRKDAEQAAARTALLRLGIGDEYIQ
ncbi:RNase III [Acanthocystis turfacea Chlorella virus NTS-1]|nr:RNase III [Acanthocystis turfacea Chlorella virus NTS-1]